VPGSASITWIDAHIGTSLVLAIHGVAEMIAVAVRHQDRVEPCRAC
jgi:hypothetical protein